MANNNVKYVLFVHKNSAGSNRCVRLLQASASADTVKIVNIANIPAQKRPPFVTGAPILVETLSNHIYKGTHACLSQLEGLTRDNKMYLPPSAETGYTASFDGTPCANRGYQHLDLSETLEGPSFESKNQVHSPSKYNTLRDSMAQSIQQKVRQRASGRTR